MSDWRPLTDLTTLKSQGRSVHELDGHSVLLLFTGGDVLAVSARCTHFGLSMARGRIIAGQLFCPHHGACFDLRSGAALSGPAVAPLPRYEVRIEDDAAIAIRLPDCAQPASLLARTG